MVVVCGICGLKITENNNVIFTDDDGNTEELNICQICHTEKLDEFAEKLLKSLT